MRWRILYHFELYWSNLYQKGQNKAVVRSSIRGVQFLFMSIKADKYIHAMCSLQQVHLSFDQIFAIGPPGMCYCPIACVCTSSCIMFEVLQVCPSYFFHLALERSQYCHGIFVIVAFRYVEGEIVTLFVQHNLCQPRSFLFSSGLVQNGTVQFYSIFIPTIHFCACDSTVDQFLVKRFNCRGCFLIFLSPFSCSYYTTFRTGRIGSLDHRHPLR